MRNRPGQNPGGVSLRPAGFRGPARRLQFPAAALFALLLAACRTPPPPLPEADPASALPAGADLYFTVSVPENRDFLRRAAAENGLRSRGADYLLDRARVVLGAASFPEGGGIRITAAAEGDFSRALVEFGVRGEDGWKENVLDLENGGVRYYRAAGGNEISAPSDRIILLAAGGGMEAGLRALYGSAPAAADLPREHRSRGAGFRFSRPGERLARVLSGIGAAFPLDSAEVYADRTGGGFSVSGGAVFASERDARAAAVLVRLFLSGLLAAEGKSYAEIRGSLSVETAGRAALFSGAEFSDDSAAAFLKRSLESVGAGKRK